MPVTITCDVCLFCYQVDEENLGSELKCKHCRARFVAAQYFPPPKEGEEEGVTVQNLMETGLNIGSVLVILLMLGAGISLLWIDPIVEQATTSSESGTIKKRTLSQWFSDNWASRNQPKNSRTSSSASSWSSNHIPKIPRQTYSIPNGLGNSESNPKTHLNDLHKIPHVQVQPSSDFWKEQVQRQNTPRYDPNKMIQDHEKRIQEIRNRSKAQMESNQKMIDQMHNSLPPAFRNNNR